MRAALRRLGTGREFGPRESLAVLAAILLAAAIHAAIHAVSKPFWYDEICTVIVCRLPNLTEIWNALGSAADTNPPVFYLVARLTRQLVSDDHFGYRLPSMLGELGTLVLVYAVLARRVKPLSALVGTAFLLCTPLALFAFEARPYALMLCCLAGAIFAWQRLAGSPLYALALAGALAGAVSLHYYAILAWPAFAMAETLVLFVRRRFRIGAWAAFAAGALPLLYFAPLLLKLREYYGQNFWAKPSFKAAFLAHDWLFSTGSHWGVLLAAGLTVVLAGGRWQRAKPGQEQDATEPAPIEEFVLLSGLLWLPFIAVAAAKISHGGMTERYMLPAILGGALALGYAVDRVSSAGRLLLLVLLVMNFASSAVKAGGHIFGGTLLAARVNATREVSALAGEAGEPALPIVISEGFRYLPMAYYTPADSSARLFAVADPYAAVTSTESKSDSLDLALLVLRRYAPLHVEDYAGFVSKNREFLLVLGGGVLDWWPARLAQDGYSLRLLSAKGGNTIYKVTTRR